MVNNIPVNGWPQLKELEAVQPTLDRLDKIEAWKRTVKEETFTGDDITIENALALPARSLITEINAIQDLHGLPFPYVGGAYKNKLPMTVDGIKALNTDSTWVGNDYTHNGVKFTILTDSANNVIGISANGTTSANHVIFKLGQLTLQGGINYTLTGCPSGGSLDGYRLSNWGSNTVDVNDLGSGATITVSNDELYTLMVYIKNSGTVLSNKIFYPMIRLSTESDTSFAPYSNICPISGRDSVVLTRSDGDEISEDFTIQLGTTVYGAEINWDTGVATVTHANIASYDGETIGEPWISSMDEYTQGGTPTTGAQVVYTVATPTTIQLTSTQLEMLKGYNHITLSDGYGTIELKALTGANWS